MSEEKIDAIKVAHLSRLTLTDDEAKVLTNKCSNILESFNVVQSVQVEDYQGEIHIRGREDLRRDEMKPSLGQEKALATAPQSFNGHFRVPAVIT